MNLRKSKSKFPEDRKPPYPYNRIEHYNCWSDLGNIRIHRSGEIPVIPTQLEHKMSYTFVVTPKIIESDESIRRISPQE